MGQDEQIMDFGSSRVSVVAGSAGDWILTTERIMDLLPCDKYTYRFPLTGGWNQWYLTMARPSRWLETEHAVAQDSGTWRFRMSCHPPTGSAHTANMMDFVHAGT